MEARWANIQPDVKMMTVRETVGKALSAPEEKKLLERGTPLAVVSSIMGWSAGTTAKMAKRYGHIGSEATRIAMEALDDSPRKQPAEEDSGNDQSRQNS
jgi:hypothetical protein